MCCSVFQQLKTTFNLRQKRPYSEGNDAVNRPDEGMCKTQYYERHLISDIFASVLHVNTRYEFYEFYCQFLFFV
jgi:hypothetical protein